MGIGHSRTIQAVGIETESGNGAKNQLPTSSLASETASFTYPRPAFDLLERHIDEPRELRVAVIGGGLSGITAGILLPAKVPGIQLTIFEKNHDFVRFSPSSAV